MRFADKNYVRNDVQHNLSYSVYFSRDIFDPKNIELIKILSDISSQDKNKAIVFIDQGLLDQQHDLTGKIRHYFHTHHECLILLGTYSIPGGELCKTDITILDSIYKLLLDHKVDRHSFVMVLGGGAVLDAVGFAASTTHRGIRLLRFPTTILAQNDAGIGVKTGINRFEKKNFIGTFSVPAAVINDPLFLNTLSDRDKRSGMAEAIKVALIRDKSFFEWMEMNIEKLTHFDPKTILHMIQWCADLHLTQITNGGDPFETGSSRPLDFGHWAAHKLESISMFNLKHGEAVAIGIAIDTLYSFEMGQLPKTDLNRILSLLHRLGFNLKHPLLEIKKNDGTFLVLDGIDEFREHLGGILSITMLTAIGTCKEVHTICRETMESTIKNLVSDGVTS